MSGRALIKALKLKEVLTSSCVSPPPTIPRSPRYRLQLQARRADCKKKAHQDQLKPSAPGREQDKWRQRGSITRNLCTDVKQLERSQGPDSMVPMCHGSDMPAKPPNNHSFLLPRPTQIVVLVSYISSQAGYWFRLGREKAQSK